MVVFFLPPLLLGFLLLGVGVSLLFSQVSAINVSPLGFSADREKAHAFRVECCRMFLCVFMLCQANV